MKNIVYKISNIANGKMYFGATRQPLKIRWQQHKCNANKRDYILYRAIKKYGFENFIIEIVFATSNEKEMFEKEIELINLYKTNDKLFGYNHSTGGQYSRKGCRLTNEQKQKISEYQKIRIRKPHSEETKRAIGIANTNKIRSEELKKRWSESRKGVESPNKKMVILNNELIFNSLTEASIKTGVSITAIVNNLKGLSNLTKKGKWNYYQQK